MSNGKKKIVNTITSNILIYQTEDGKTKIETVLENETVWLSIEQMAEVLPKEFLSSLPTIEMIESEFMNKLETKEY